MAVFDSLTAGGVAAINTPIQQRRLFAARQRLRRPSSYSVINRMVVIAEKLLIVSQFASIGGSLSGPISFSVQQPKKPGHVRIP
jgi:hypothetical protein